jgi:DNA-binding transcriptional regulator YdaS (Cro superfamily)
VGDRVHERALLRAAGIVGGIDSLAEKLKVHPAVLVAWMRGTAKVPDEVFLSVVDVVLERNFDSLRPDDGSG